MTTTSFADPELAAMWAALRALEPLDQQARLRAIEWLRQRCADDHPRGNVVRFRPDELDGEIPV